MDKITALIYRNSTIISAAILLVGCLFPLWTAWHLKDLFLNDDTYITLTFAKNLARGDGFVYNHPPPTLGTTSPLLALGTALLAFILRSENIQAVAVFFTAACWIAISWTIFMFRRSFGLEDWQAAVIGLALFASGFVLRLGMEVYMFAFLLTLSIALFSRGNYFLAGAGAGLLFLTRGEGVLLFFLLLLTGFLRIWKKDGARGRILATRSAVLLVGFLLPILPWLVYAGLTFGSVFPNSLEVKQLQGQDVGFPPPFFHTLVYYWLMDFGNNMTIAGYRLLNVSWIMASIGLGYAFARRRIILLFPAWMALYIAGYTLLDVPASYPWYKLPILFVLQLLAALGVTGVMILLSRMFQRKWLKLALPTAVAVLYLYFLGNQTILFPTAATGDPRGPGYTAMSSWFRENTSPDESIAYLEVGYLGYYTDNRIIDTAGLVTPEVIPHLKVHDTDWVYQEYIPYFIVRQRDFDGISLFKPPSPEILSQYESVATFPGVGENPLEVLQRKN